MEKENIIKMIYKIREEIGHKKIKPDVIGVVFRQDTKDLFIITSDRPEKSAVIGKGGWVVGKLREKLNINSIHVEAYSDILIRRYRMKLALDKLNEIPKICKFDTKPLENLHDLILWRIKNIPYCSLQDYTWDMDESKTHQAIVALSGGVDSSFSLIIAKKMGFNPTAATIDPGDIIIPEHQRKGIEELCGCLEVEHRYIEVDMHHVISDSLKGRFHPCGRCSKIIENSLLDYAKDRRIPFLIYGDLLSTGTQSILSSNGIIRINLPAMLSTTKQEVQKLTSKFGIRKKRGYGCPLLKEVHKKYPYMRRFSIQRILRETRAGVLEPGEALNMIMSTQ